MKRFCIFLLVAIALVACEKENESVIRNTDLQEVVAQNKVSLKDALLYAENSINGINPTTRSAERKVKSTEIYVAKPATRSAEDTEVSFYLINYEDNEGFAMVSTDSRATPVYAYADEGNLTPEDLETNPLYNIFMDSAVPYYEYEVSNYQGPLPPEIPDTLDHGRIIMVDNDVPCYINTDTLTVSEEAFTETAWHQDSPYNHYIEENGHQNCLAGCVPVAAAQIMAYHEWPTVYNGYTFDYYTMKLEEVSYMKNSTALQAAQLIYQFAEQAGTIYNTFHNGGSKTNAYNAREVLVDFGYSCSNVTDYSPYLIRQNIDRELPVLVSGQKNPGDVEGGHTWVVDAYEYKYKIIKYYRAEFPYELYKSNTAEMTTYFRCNSGYDDINNPKPYLLSNNFHFEYNDRIFNHNLKMIYNIEPNN